MKQPHVQEKNITYYAVKVIGFIFIVIGVIGLVLPFLQGIALILAGIALLGGKRALRRCKRFAMHLVGVWRRMVH